MSTTTSALVITCDPGPGHLCQDSSTGSVETATQSESTSSVRDSFSSVTQISTSPTVSSTSIQPAGVSATSTSSTGSHQAGSISSNFSTAVFAGATVGCFVAGALLAGLIACLLLRRRSKRDKQTSRHHNAPSYDRAYSGEKGVPMVAMNVVMDNSFLPPQADDAEVKRRILNLTDQIDQHVENFYSNQRIQLNASMEGIFSRYETGQMPNPLSMCFEQATYPLALITHCLAFHMFAQTLAPSEDAQLMLPKEIAGMITAMYHKCLSATVPQDTLSAFSSWKSLTGYLRPQTGKAQRTSQSPSEEAVGFARNFSTAFTAWSNPQFPEQYRVHHLATLVDHAIETATWLFCQPDSYKFSWNTLSHGHRDSKTRTFAREIVIVPEVFKTTHKGVRLSGREQEVLKAVVKEF